MVFKQLPAPTLDGQTFENDVKMYGIQTREKAMEYDNGLRMM